MSLNVIGFGMMWEGAIVFFDGCSLYIKRLVFRDI